MKKRNVLVLVLGLVIALPASAQWDRWHTSTAISGVLGVASKAIESAERKKEMEILARQKVEFEQSFQDAMTEAISETAFCSHLPASVARRYRV